MSSYIVHGLFEKHWPSEPPILLRADILSQDT